MSEKEEFLEQLKRLKTLADLGLFYATNDFDKERYEEILEMSFRFQNILTNHSVEELKTIYNPVKEYTTAKVDIRGMLLSEDKKILLVRESIDGKWALPGGWADVGFSPKENIIKEFKEEAGMDVEVVRLLSVMDKKNYPHPYQPYYIYKLFFHCKALSDTLNHGFDILDVNFFAIDKLPELSEDRILKSQIELLYNKIKNNDLDTNFD